MPIREAAIFSPHGLLLCTGLTHTRPLPVVRGVYGWSHISQSVGLSPSHPHPCALLNTLGCPWVSCLMHDDTRPKGCYSDLRPVDPQLLPMGGHLDLCGDKAETVVLVFLPAQGGEGHISDHVLALRMKPSLLVSAPLCCRAHTTYLSMLFSVSPEYPTSQDFPFCFKQMELFKLTSEADRRSILSTSNTDSVLHSAALCADDH